jgi:hypothetical protein
MASKSIGTTKSDSFGHQLQALLGVAALAVVAGCSTEPAAPPAPSFTGAAGGGTSVGADSNLQTCPEPVGTVRLEDGQTNPDTSGSETASNGTIQSLRLLLKDIKDLGPKDKSSSDGVSIDALRLLIQQSNCLVIVDRGASEAAASDEKRRTRSSNGEVRDDANMGKGQEVAADFVLRSKVLSLGTEKSSGVSLGAVIPFSFAQGLSASESVSSANVQLVLSDVRAKIQLAVAQGAGSGKNTGMATNILGRAGGMFGGAQAKTQSSTSTATVLLQAMADAYNKLVPALRNYKSQTVKGGLGAGGTLRVQGAKADASAVSPQK